MTIDDLDFEPLLRRAQNGCPEAARALFDRYREPVLRAVRRRLHPRLRSVYDSEDFVQTVFKSFFREPLDFAGPAALVAFLTEVAGNKVAEAFRAKLVYHKQNLNRETPLDAVGEDLADAHQPTASQEAVADEKWERLTRHLTPAQRQVLGLIRMGYTRDEVSARTGLHVKAIQRLLRRLAEETEAQP